MSGTFALGLSCGRAGEPVLLRSEVFRRTEIEFFTAVGAEHHAGKQALLPLTGRSALVFTELLNLLKCGTVNDGGMSVGKDFPIFFRAVDFLFVFEGLCGRAKIDGIAHVFLPLQHIGDGGLHPPTRDSRL